MDFNDFNEITCRRYQYAQGIDTKDFDLLRSVFTDQITMDFFDYNGLSATTLNADDWVKNVRDLMTGLDSTQHVLTNPIVEVNGDDATCSMYMKAEHFLQNLQGSSNYTIGGYYVDKLVRLNGRWSIKTVTLKLFWQRGNRNIMQIARKKISEGQLDYS